MNVKNFFDKDTKVNEAIAELKKTGISIYGAGKIGERLIAAFNYFEIPIVHVWDNRFESISELLGHKVAPSPEEEGNYDLDTPVFISIFAPLVAEEVKNNLTQVGFNNIQIDRSFINNLLGQHCLDMDNAGKFNFDLNECMLCPLQKDEYQTCSLFDKNIINSKGGNSRQPEDFFVVRSVGLLITSKCNLTCIGCNHLRDHYSKENNVEINADLIISDLHKFLSGVDFLKTLVLVGGEAFLHKSIEKIILEILKYPNIGMLHIISNGTVVPKDDVIALLDNPRVFVEISGYGSNVGNHLIEKRNIFFKKMNEHNVNHRYAEYFKWTDFGDFEERSYNEDQIRETYLNCCFVSNDIFNGEIHKCSRSAYGKFIGVIPDYKEDYVNIRECPDGELRERLKHFFADERPRVCNHCNGTNNATIDAGVQKRS